MSFEAPKEWKLNITPQDIFHIDSQDFKDFENIGDFLSQTIKTKSDLITALHFSKLHSKCLDLYFTLSKIDPADFKDWCKKMKQRIAFEKEEWGDWIHTHDEREKNIPVNLDDYIFNDTWDRWALEKQIPMTSEAQLEYLDQLIDQWYFNMDNYNSRWQRITDLLHSMACTAWSDPIYYKIGYSKYVTLETFKKNKLSDECLYTLTRAQLRNSSYLYNLLDFLKNIHEYPELINRIIKCLNTLFLENKRTKIIWSNKYYPEETKGIDSNDTRKMIEKWLL